METEGLERIVRDHPFFAGLGADFQRLAGGCARNVRFEVDEHLCRESEPANEFYLLRHGRVALQVHGHGRSGVTFQTLDEGDVVGVSWLVPPYRWNYDAIALEPVRAIAIDAACLRDKCEADSRFGYEVMKRFVPLLVERLHTTRLQMLDVYGRPA